MTTEWTFAVTFESDTQAPETVRGTVTGRLSAALSRAARLARKQKPTRNRYTSVVVLVEKVDKQRADVTIRTGDAGSMVRVVDIGGEER